MARLSTAITIILSVLAILSLVEATRFSGKLIHRDHSKSPATRYENQRQAFLRSFSRSRYLKSRISNSDRLLDATPADFQSDITPAAGEYLMEAAIGTPPFTIQAIADTGSDLTWTQCSPCTNCYKQTAPLFKPSDSKTYNKLTCDDKQCQNPDQTTCDETNHCQYQFFYGDSSHTTGDLAADTLTFKSSSGRNVSIPNVVIGCGFDNNGTFSESGSGIIGLGSGPLSIISQLDSQVRGKFSYCLGNPFDTSSSSKISFGDSAVVPGSKTVSTPLYQKAPPLDTFYFLNMESVTLAKSPNATSKPSPVSEDAGNIIIDSGTTLTLLPQDIYADLETAVKSAVTAPIADSQIAGLTLCYKAAGGDISGFPDLVVHFTGADVVLPASSAFVEVSDGVVCLSFVPIRDPELQQPIFGNLAQQNYYIGYDIQGQKLSFQPTDCSKAA